MEYQIVLPPELGVRAADFVAAWNASPEHQAVAAASEGEATARSFDPTLGVAVVELLLVLAGGVASNALYELIKESLVRQGVRKRTTIVEHSRPDGTRLLVVTVEEE